MVKTYLLLPVEYDEKQTDPESLCSVIDTLLAVGRTQIGPITEYGPFEVRPALTFPANPDFAELETNEDDEATWQLPLPNGGKLVCYGGTAVHIYDADDNEIVMWADNEWEEDPVVVMNAIFMWACQSLENQTRDSDLDAANKVWIRRPFKR